VSDLHPNTLRVIAAAREAGLEIMTRRFPEGTKTAADAAAAIGVTVGQIVKSLVFGVDNEIVMALVSGLVAIRRGVGRGRNVERQLRCEPE
jgi:prolyl-tRNA editing enzyme YbaK/EbsC (Cys-tRNA(Pro) deacylase)